MRKIGFLLLSALLLTGCAPKPQSPAQQSSQSTSTSQVSQSSVTPKTAIKVSLATAVKKFEQRFGKTVTLTEVSLEAEGRRYLYEISGVDDQQAYELTVDARSGKTSRAEQEKLDTDEANGVERRRAGIELNQLKSLTTISKAATRKIGGGEAIAWALEMDRGTPEWEVKVREKQTEREVHVNAKTGQVVRVEADD